MTNKEGNHIGFIAKDWASVIAPKMDFGLKYKVIIKEKQPKVIQCNAKLINLEDIILPTIFQ